MKNQSYNELTFHKVTSQFSIEHHPSHSSFLTRGKASDWL